MKLNRSKQLIVAAASLALLTSVYGDPTDTPAPASGADAPATQTADKEAKPVKDTFDSLGDVAVVLMKKQVDTLGTVKDEATAHKAAKSLDKIGDEHIALYKRLRAINSPSDAELERFEQKMDAAEKSVRKDFETHMRFISRSPSLRVIIAKAMRDYQVKRSKAPDFRTDK